MALTTRIAVTINAKEGIAVHEQKNKIIRAVAYPRYSSDNQREESIAAQMRAIEEYCRQKGYVLVGSYPDEEKSATTDRRPNFQRMIEDSAKGLFDVVVVHKLDRFARNRYDSAVYKHILRKNGVRVESVLERFDDSPESVILESVLEGFAEYYSLNLAREVTKGMRENALAGRHVGGTPPYGLKVNPETLQYEINEKEAPAVRMYFELIDQGVSKTKIAQILNEAGFRTRTGKPFTKHSFDGWARNRKYRGDFTWNVSIGRSGGERGKRSSKTRPAEEQIIIPGVIPAIVQPDLFDRVNAKLETRRKRGGASKAMAIYILSGKVFCGNCGSLYAGLTYTNRPGKGRRYFYYRCQKKCGSRQIPKADLEQAVIDRIADQVFSEEAVRRIVKRVQEMYAERRKTSGSQRETIEQEIRDLERKIDNWLELLGEGIGNRQALIEKVNAATEKKEYLERELLKIQAMERVPAISEHEIMKVLNKKKDLLLSASDANKKKVIEEFVDQVTVSWDGDILHVKIACRVITGAGEPSPTITLHFDTQILIPTYR